METMSLWESGESSGDVCFISLFDRHTEIVGKAKLSREGVTKAIVRGGWPVAVLNEKKNPLIYGKQALRSICSTDLKEATGMDVDPNAVLALIKSLARNITIPVKNETLISDMAEFGNPVAESTFYLYLNGLRRLFVLRGVPAWNPNIRSATSIRSLPKKEFYETSIACALSFIGASLRNDGHELASPPGFAAVARALDVGAADFSGFLDGEPLGLEQFALGLDLGLEDSDDPGVLPAVGVFQRWWA